MQGGQFQDLCEFVEMGNFDDATYLWPKYTLVLFTDSKCPCPMFSEFVKIEGAQK